MQYARQLSDNKRTKVIHAVQTSLDRYFAGETFTSINIAPRYGKSSIIRLIALEWNAVTKMPLVMAAPWVDNVDQILEKEKAEKTFRDYGIPLSVPFTAHRIRGPLRTFNWWRMSDGTVPTLLSCTLDMIINAASRASFCDGLDDMHQRFGYRPIFVIDESQLVKELRARGQYIVSELVKQNDVYVVLLTGTPVPGIPGFEDDWTEWQDIIRKIPRRKIINGKVEHVLETYEGPSRKLVNISADVEVTWQEAWDIKALAGVNSVWINCDVYDEGGILLGPLATLEEQALNGRLKEIMESPDLMRKQVQAALRRLIAKRAKPGGKGTQILVPTGQDDLLANSGNIDNHPRQFKQMFQEESAKLGLRLRIEIATGNVENAAALIKEFRKGLIDVLIVKGMALVGIDVPTCKVLVWGTRLRQGPLALQALSRVLTTWEGMRADIIMPEDVKMVRFYNRAVKDLGGEASESHLTLTDEEPYVPPDDNLWSFQDPRIDAYSDEKGQTLTGDFELILQIIKFKYEIDGLSDLQIIENYNRGGFPFTEADKQVFEMTHQKQQQEAETSAVENLDEDLDEIRGQFGREAKKIVSKHIPYNPTDRVQFTEAIKKLQNQAKQLCSVSSSVKVSEVADAALLKQLKAALAHAETIVFPTAI